MASGYHIVQHNLRVFIDIIRKLYYFIEIIPHCSLIKLAKIKKIILSVDHGLVRISL